MTDLQTTLTDLCNQGTTFSCYTFTWGWTIVIPAKGDRTPRAIEFNTEQQLDLNKLEHRLWNERGFEPHYLIGLSQDELIKLYDNEFNRK